MAVIMRSSSSFLLFWTFLVHFVVVQSEESTCSAASGVDFWQCMAEKMNEAKGSGRQSQKADDELADIAAESDCVDRETDCVKRAAENECARNPSFMLEHCRKSCAVCDKQRNGGGKQANCYGEDQVVTDEVAARLQQVEDYMLRKVFVQEEFGDVKLQVRARWANESLSVAIVSSCDDVCLTNLLFLSSKCKNRHESCTFWASSGECDANPLYMKLQVRPGGKFLLC